MLLHRDGNPSELIALAETMGIEILDVQYQKGIQKTHVHILGQLSMKVDCTFQTPYEYVVADEISKI